MTSPWEDIGWTEKAYLNWLRSQTRRTWSRHPVKTEYIKQHREKAPLGRNGKLVWASKCEMCNTLKKQSDCEVDHITQGGSFSTWEEYTEWAKRILWVGFDELRILCKDCHNLVNISQKLGCSIEEAVVEKRRIEFFKQKVAVQKERLTHLGATEDEIRNSDSRLKAFYKYFKEEK